MSDVEETEAQRWCYKASFGLLPEVFALLAELGIEWKLIDAYPMGATVLFETGYEVECAWRRAGMQELKRYWTQRQEAGPCLIVCERVRVDDAEAFEALLDTRDPSPLKTRA